MKAIEKVQIIVNALEEKKGIDIKILDIHEVSVIADYFVIASAGNSSQLAALQDSVQEELFKVKIHAKSVEGTRDSSWILMDYNDVIVHLFPTDQRVFYDLERIWRDGKEITL